MLRVDKYVLATMNRRNVLELIRKRGPIYKAEIARIAELSVPTVMKLADEFSRMGLIRTIGKGDSMPNGGKRPDLLEFVPKSHYIIGVDIGRNTLKVILMDLSSRIFGKSSAKTGDNCSPQMIIPRLLNLIEGAILSSGVELGNIIGMGVGMPGLLDAENGRVIFSPDYHWENVDLIAPLQAGHDMSIMLENSNRALAMGEKWFGAGQSADYFICVNLGCCIGSAIVENGDIYRGACGSSGELGHMTMEKDGPMCDCGNTGCLEALASGNAIARQARELAASGKPTLMYELAGGRIDAIDAKIVFDAAKLGDSLARGVVDAAIEHIGIGLANYINLLDPEMIILGGGLSNAGDVLINGIMDVVQRRRMKHAGRRIQIVQGMRGGDATAIGAASFILKSFIESGGVMQRLERRSRVG
jgi:glucokinase-like ROK family protein